MYLADVSLLVDLDIGTHVSLKVFMNWLDIVDLTIDG